MFFNPKKKNFKKLDELNASILLVMQSGKILFASEELKSKPRDWFGGSVLEVMISRPGMDPFFIYYENFDYYKKMVAGMQSISIDHEYETYRTDVSLELCKFLVLHLRDEYQKDIRHPQMQFSHNKIHTNVIAYVEKFRQWYPIQHASDESDSATDDKVAMVNRGMNDLTEFIAMHRLSPQ
jgi:hypothetical protein